jgi:hypothetical protein
MDFVMPTTFPEAEFRAFGLSADSFFPHLMSDKNLFDPLERRRHFDWSWQAVRYRFRICTECNDQFKALLANPSESWRAGWGDEELTYKIERCIYIFFMSSLSVLESFGFCLYFLGAALRPSDFPHFDKPKKITLEATSKAFMTAYPKASITKRLAELLQEPEFTWIERLRNILAHRVSGRRSVRGEEDTWHIPGSPKKLTFDEQMIQRELDEITSMLTVLTTAAREFAEVHKPVEANVCPLE